MKRWIIRSFFIGLLLLCVGGWGWSYIRCEDLSHVSHDGAELYSYGLEISRGKLVLMYTVANEITMGGEFTSEGWNWFYRHERPSYFIFGAGGISSTAQGLMDEMPGLQNLGFHVYGKSRTYSEWDHTAEYFAQIPMWFPTVVSAAFLWLAWRKTRSATKGPAFPVQLAKHSGKP